MDHLTKMYTVRKNVCQMLEDRGFLVGEVRCCRSGFKQSLMVHLEG